MSATLATLSNNFVYSATAVYGLAMLAHAAEWAVARERRTAPPDEAAAGHRSATRESAASEDTGERAVDAAAGHPGSEREPDEVLVGAATGPEGLLARGAPRADNVGHVSNGGGSGDGIDAAGVESNGVTPEQRITEERIDRFGRIGIALTMVATLLIGAGVVSRGVAADRVPWSNLYEFTITAVFIVSVAYLGLFRRFRLAWLGLPITGVLLVSIVVAVVVLYEPVSGLIPALRSYWLVIHVSAATTATGVFTVGVLASVLQLVKSRWERRVAAGEAVPRGNLARLPAAESIDRVAYRLHAFAFPIWTFALICGALWAREAWGRYWGWDPKEVWMFITWIAYAAYLHARSTAGWRSKTPWISLVAYGCLLFNLIGVNFVISGLHSYA